MLRPNLVTAPSLLNPGFYEVTYRPLPTDREGTPETLWVTRLPVLRRRSGRLEYRHRNGSEGWAVDTFELKAGVLTGASSGLRIKLRVREDGLDCTCSMLALSNKCIGLICGDLRCGRVALFARMTGRKRRESRVLPISGFNRSGARQRSAPQHI
jgi:hypothetical protein